MIPFCCCAPLLSVYDFTSHPSYPLSFFMPNQHTARLCSHKECHEEGLYKAPRSPTQIHDYLWFCLKHVREYNARWDCLAGCSAQEIERRIREATVWERPTWPLGKGPFSPKRAKEPMATPLPAPVLEALKTLRLTPPVSIKTVKSRYRELVKKYHPDTGDAGKDSLKKFHALQQAFTVLKAYYVKKKEPR